VSYSVQFNTTTRLRILQASHMCYFKTPAQCAPSAESSSESETPVKGTANARTAIWVLNMIGFIGFAGAAGFTYGYSSDKKQLDWMATRPYNDLFAMPPDVQQLTYIKPKWFVLAVCAIMCLHYAANYMGSVERQIGCGYNANRWYMYMLALPVINCIMGNMLEPMIDVWWIAVYALWTFGAMLFLYHGERAAVDCPGNNAEIFLNLHNCSPCCAMDFKNSSSLWWLAFMSWVAVFARPFWVYGMTASGQQTIVEWMLIAQFILQFGLLMNAIRGFRLIGMWSNPHMREIYHLILSIAIGGVWAGMMMSAETGLPDA